MGCFKAIRFEPPFPLVGFVVARQHDAAPLDAPIAKVEVTAVLMLLGLAADLLERLEIGLRRFRVVEVGRFPLGKSEADDLALRRASDGRHHAACTRGDGENQNPVHSFCKYFVLLAQVRMGKGVFPCTYTNKGHSQWPE